MVNKLISILLCSALGISAAMYHQKTEVPKAEEFSQEQIEMFESMVTFNPVAEVKREVTIVPIEETYIIRDEIPLSEDLQKWCQDKCRQYKLSYSFFLAIINSESSFICYGDTIDGSGISTGYMQIRKCNWDRYDDLDVHDPYDNIEIGIRMLSELKEKYMSTDKIIMAYKGGETAMLNWVEQGIRLDICDVIEDEMNYWEEVLNGSDK